MVETSEGIRFGGNEFGGNKCGGLFWWFIRTELFTFRVSVPRTRANGMDCALLLLADHASFRRQKSGGKPSAQWQRAAQGRLRSGPLGGDQQIGALIAEGVVDAVIFLVDPLTPMPHDVDVKALMRLAIVYDIPIALNVATAEIILTAMEADGRKGDRI